MLAASTGTPARYVGLMSGTSLDGADAVLVDFSGSSAQVLGHAHQVFEPSLRAELLALNQAGPNELHRCALAANGVSRVYAQLTQTLLARTGLSAEGVLAMGAHGQTVRHQPGLVDGVGYTSQLLNAPLLAELCGIDVVHDLRSRDLAVGGQGAPLVPAVHAALFRQEDAAVAVVNVGGMSNVTLLPPGRLRHLPVSGWDSGPGNVLMDAWVQRHTGQAFDRDGAFAAQGQVHPGLLSACLAEPYFHQAPPKSTGRDLFSLPWLSQRYPALTQLSPADVQATLCALTAETIAKELSRGLQDPSWCAQAAAGGAAASGPTEILVCGGGAYNGLLMAQLQQALDRHQAFIGPCQVTSTQQKGLPPDQVEALAFAWLAHAFVTGQPGNLPAVTGARAGRVLGSWTPRA